VSFHHKIRDYAVPLNVFAVSRLGLFLLVYITLVFFPIREGRQYWHGFRGNRFLDGWTRFDSGWYVRIARFGYKNIPTGNGQDTNFFPFYPVVIRGLGKVFGNVFLAGIVVSNLCFLLSLLGLYRLVRDRYGPDMARRSVYLLAFNPFSFFFSAAYSEALFLCFVIFSFFFAERKRYFLAGLCAAFAGATRNIGIFTFVGIGLVALKQMKEEGGGVSPKAMWLLLGLVGPLSYVGFLAVKFGDPLLFLHAQKAWGAFNPEGILDYVFNTFRHGPVRTWGYSVLFLFHFLLGVSAVCVVLKERRFLGLPYVVFSLLLILPAFLRFTSMGRYLIVVFPLFVALGKLGEKKWVYRSFLFVESGLLILFSFMFSHWYWVA